MVQEDPINHHYLPVFYLSRWQGIDGRVVRYYRPCDRVIASAISPSNTAFEPRLYTLEGFPKKIEQAVEREYMAPVVDDPAAMAFNTLITRNYAVLTAKVCADWTRFLLSLSLRDPQSLVEIQKSHLDVLRANMSRPDAEYDATKRVCDPATPYEYVEEHAPHLLTNLGKTLLPKLIEHEEICTHIMRMSWKVIDLSSSKVDLLTADRPVLQYEGLAHQNCLITLPLSPSFLFVAANRQDIFDQILQRHTLTDIAKKANSDVVARAIKYVYGKTNKYLRFVERRLVKKDKQPLPGIMGRHLP
jgi:hypothetical protein